MLYHVREYADYLPLQSSGCIAQPKGYAMVGEYPNKTGKHHCLLIFGVYKDLVISRITIQEAIVIMPSQALHHLINQ